MADASGRPEAPTAEGPQSFLAFHRVPRLRFSRYVHGLFFAAHLEDPPAEYLSLWPNRMTLLHFAITGLDLLDQLEVHLPPGGQRRAEVIEWVYSLQTGSNTEPAPAAVHAEGPLAQFQALGGFRGAPLIQGVYGPHSAPAFTPSDNNCGAESAQTHNNSPCGRDCAGPMSSRSLHLPTPYLDVATLPATYSALCILLALGDSLQRVRRGPLAELLTATVRTTPAPASASVQVYSSPLEDEADVRFAYCACAIAELADAAADRAEAGAAATTAGASGTGAGVDACEPRVWPALPLPALAAYLSSLQARDGGFALLPAAAAASAAAAAETAASAAGAVPSVPRGLYPRLPHALTAPVSLEGHGGSTYTALASWALLCRHDSSVGRSSLAHSSHCSGGSTLAPTASVSAAALHWAALRQGEGYSGRVGKGPDSCYSFWVGAAVHLLVGDAAAATLVNTAGNRAFLTRDCEGHRAGFGRDEESAAEIYHSFYALAGLAIMQGEDGRDACGDVVTPDAQSGANAGAEARVGAGTEDKDEEAETCELHREEHWRLRPIDPLLGITRRAACTEGVVYEPLCAVFRAPA